MPQPASELTTPNDLPAPESSVRLRTVPPAPALTPAQAIDQASGIARSLARRFARFGADFDDALQQAHLAILLAARTWLPAAGASFLTWATVAIRAALGRMLKKERRRGLVAFGGTGDAHALGFSVGRTSSMDQTIDEAPSMHDRIGVAAEQEDAVCEMEVMRKIRAAVERLPARDRTIWAMSTEGATSEEIGRASALQPASIFYRLAKISAEIELLIRTGKGHPGADGRAQLITWGALTLPVNEWSRRTGLPPHVIRRRLAAGWPVAVALTTPKSATKGPRSNTSSERAA